MITANCGSVKTHCQGLLPVMARLVPTGCTHLWNDTRFSKDILWNQKVRGKPVYLRVDDHNPLKSKHIARSFRRSVHSVGLVPAIHVFLCFSTTSRGWTEWLRR